MELNGACSSERPPGVEGEEEEEALSDAVDIDGVVVVDAVIGYDMI